MDTAPSPARRADKSRQPQTRTVVETAIAVALLAVALLELYLMKEPPQWMPFGLIALALLIYTLRGRALTEMAVGKDGISWKVDALEKRTDAVEQKTDVVEQKTHEMEQKTEQVTRAVTETRDIVAQSAPKPSARRAQAEASLRDPWSHPGLKRSKVDPADPQKGQWGGLAERNGRKLSAKVAPTDDKRWFSVTLEVKSTDPVRPLASPVRFHLHDTFNPFVVMKDPVKGVARLHRYAVGGFTVGAEVENEPGTFLELDLAKLPGIPKQFRDN